jgi:hypothetical protein
MNDDSSSRDTKSAADGLRGRRVAAGVLLAVAAVALLGQYLPLNWREGFVLLLGVGFVVWAGLARSRGLLVPGGVLVGVGTGILLRGEYGHGAFLFSMAGGFLLISLLSSLMFGREKSVWWPIFPAGGLAFAAVMATAGPEAREWWRAVQPFWPWALVAVALYLLFTKPRGKE